MRTIMIRTKDIIGVKDQEGRKLLNRMYAESLRCGLKSHIQDNGTEAVLALEGSKRNFVKYYFLTVLDNNSVFRGIIRLFDIILTF